MGIICSDEDRQITLGSYACLGRDPAGLVIDPSRTVSRFHAEMRWGSNSWWLKDLNSKNGTFVDGRRLSSTPVELHVGAKVRFGESERQWSLIDDKSPRARAYINQKRVVEGDERVLGLPDEKNPRITIMARSGRWEAETAAGTQRVRDGYELECDEGVFRLELPAIAGGSLTTTGTTTPSLHALALHFRKDAPDEYAHITGARGRIQFNLGRRAHHDLLLFLAKIRAREQEEGVPEHEAGWVFVNELRAALGKDETAVNLHIYRARRALHAAGIPNGSEIVQRRQGTGQIRIGSRHLMLPS